MLNVDPTLMIDDPGIDRRDFFQLGRGVEPLRHIEIFQDQSIAHHDIASRVSRDVRLVRDHDDGDAALVELLKNSHDLDTGPAVEISRRLVGQHHFGIVHQRARNRDPLLLAAGKLTRMMFFAPGKSNRRQNRVRFVAQLRVGQAMRAVKQWQLDILARRSARQQIETLKNETEFVIANICELIAIEHGNIGIIQNVTTGSRPIETSKNIHERRFAGTARSHQRDEFAALDLERNAAHRVNIDIAGVIRLVNVDQFDDFAVFHSSMSLGKSALAAERIGRRRSVPAARAESSAVTT